MSKLHLEIRAVKELIQDEFKSSLYLTAKELCGFKELQWGTHGEIIKNLESSSTRKLVVAPRGSFKTSLCSIAYPIWLLIRNPNERIFLGSELYTNSKNLTREIRAIFESSAFIHIFGEWRGQQWGEGELTVKRTKAYKEASITAGGVGTTKVGQHYSTVLLDDMNSQDNSNTPEKCQKVQDYYRYITSILEPTGTLALIGTRYAASDVIGAVLKDLDRTEIEANDETWQNIRGMIKDMRVDNQNSMQN